MNPASPIPFATALAATHTWAELALPTSTITQLRQLAATIKFHRARHLGRGFPTHRLAASGVRALFVGPSGTGKTMAAEAIAAEAALPLYRIDLSQIVSKYIGETEKNLGRLFDAAGSADVILLFDEADALFGRRTEVKDAHDRYANLEVSYLLQRLEECRGLVILTTNQKNNIDEAFLRRLQFVVRFR